jgi:hypothetical protein
MKAVDLVTPEILFLLCLGGIAFIVILKLIFKDRNRR